MLFSNIEKMGKNIKLKNNVYLDSSSIKAPGGQPIFKTEYKSVTASENVNVGDIIRGEILDNPPNEYKVLMIMPDYTTNNDRNFPQYNYNHYTNSIRYQIKVEYRPSDGILKVGFRYIYIHESLIEDITTG